MSPGTPHWPALAKLTATGLVAALAVGSSAAPATATAVPVRAASPGSPGVGDSLFPHAGNGGYRVGHYGLRLDYRPRADVLSGVATITARATQDLSEFNLDLSRMRVRSVRVDGMPATFARDAAELTVRPAAPLLSGHRFRVRVRYSGVPKTYVDPDGSPDGWITTRDGAVAVNEPLGAMTWYPVNNHPSDKATYQVSIRVPQRLTAISNGNLVRHRVSSGHATWVWRERDQMASYLSTVTIGRFDIFRGTTTGGVPIWSFADSRMRGAGRVAGRVAEVVDYWAKRFGPYPFSSTGVILDRARFGYALEVQTRPVFPFKPGQPTLVHELAHQWYGDSVTPKDWSDIWLNEGFATYAEWMWEARTNPGAPAEHFRRLYATPADSDLWHPPPAVPGGGANLFGPAVYNRGAMALQALRQRIGSADFARVLRRWASLHRQGNASTSQLEALAERVSGMQLDRLFQAWLYQEGKPLDW